MNKEPGKFDIPPALRPNKNLSPKEVEEIQRRKMAETNDNQGANSTK